MRSSRSDFHTFIPFFLWVFFFSLFFFSPSFSERGSSGGDLMLGDLRARLSGDAPRLASKIIQKSLPARGKPQNPPPNLPHQDPVLLSAFFSLFSVNFRTDICNSIIRPIHNSFSQQLSTPEFSTPEFSTQQIPELKKNPGLNLSF